jgi:chromodomain-helicase-DNA-binding protein 7
VKPSRRFKKITPEDLTIPSKGTVTKKQTVTRSNNEDNIFADEDEEEEDDEGSEEKVRLDEAKKDELLKRLCAFCEKPKCTHYCMSFCKRSFHEECRKKV